MEQWMQKYQKKRHHRSTNIDENSRLGSGACGRISSSASEEKKYFLCFRGAKQFSL